MASRTKDHWTTPGVVVELLHKFWDGPPFLDPCSNPRSIVGAKVEWYGPPDGQDGLVLPWSVTGGNFVNMPYSAKEEWMAKAHCEAYRGCEIIALPPANTDTAWFRHFGWPAAMRCFWYGRMKFGGDRSYHARFSSVLVYWGRRPARFRSVFQSHGHCV
jgi:hypothetical protein